MKIHELIACLKELPQEMDVILSKDGEGNGFSPWCGDISVGEYEPENTWSGEFMAYADEEVDEDDEDSGHRVSNAVVLWPVN